jgi:hypothetical protein
MCMFDDAWHLSMMPPSVIEDCYIDSGAINPATGLPMVGALDIAGNPYGFGNLLGTPVDTSIPLDDWFW